MSNLTSNIPDDSKVEYKYIGPKCRWSIDKIYRFISFNFTDEVYVYPIEKIYDGYVVWGDREKIPRHVFSKKDSNF